MSREIKFRAWVTEETFERSLPRMVYESETSDGFYSVNMKGELVLYWDDAYDPALRESVVEGYKLMQFTGLQDKNGKDIYEGDLVGYGDEDAAPITFEDGSFMWITDRRSGRSAINQDRARRLEVIGNIHENPELLEK